MKRDLETVGDNWRKREKKLETANRERSERKVRGRINSKETEIMANSPLTTGMPRKEQQQIAI